MLPERAKLFDSLPEKITRAHVLEISRNTAKSDRDAERAFLAAMVWGHGRVGYGAYRTARVLSENEEAARRLREVAAVAKKDGGVSAFRCLAQNRLDGLGVAFGTKPGSTVGPSVIMLLV